MTALATALCKAQSQIEGAKKDSTNPHFKNKYADLGSVWDACRKALADNGLSVVQFGTLTADGNAGLTTRLLHESGDYIDGTIPLLNGKGDMQGLGSALTYARRYGLAAMVGVSPEDDDGNAATAKAEPKAVPVVAPAGYADWLLDFKASADNGMAALAEAWQKTTPEYRTHANTIDPGLKERLKEKAAKVAA